MKAQPVPEKYAPTRRSKILACANGAEHAVQLCFGDHQPDTESQRIEDVETVLCGDVPYRFRGLDSKVQAKIFFGVARAMAEAMGLAMLPNKPPKSY